MDHLQKKWKCQWVTYMVRAPKSSHPVCNLWQRSSYYRYLDNSLIGSPVPYSFSTRKISSAHFRNARKNEAALINVQDEQPRVRRSTPGNGKQNFYIRIFHRMSVDMRRIKLTINVCLITSLLFTRLVFTWQADKWPVCEEMSTIRYIPWPDTLAVATQSQWPGKHLEIYQSANIHQINQPWKVAWHLLPCTRQNCWCTCQISQCGDCQFSSS